MYFIFVLFVYLFIFVFEYVVLFVELVIVIELYEDKRFVVYVVLEFLVGIVFNDEKIFLIYDDFF